MIVLGVILLVIGAIVWVLGAMGHAVAGRRHYGESGSSAAEIALARTVRRSERIFSWLPRRTLEPSVRERVRERQRDRSSAHLCSGRGRARATPGESPPRRTRGIVAL